MLLKSLGTYSVMLLDASTVQLVATALAQLLVMAGFFVRLERRLTILEVNQTHLQRDIASAIHLAKGAK